MDSAGIATAAIVANGKNVVAVVRRPSKSYWKQFDSAPEFVVMFLPGEMFFSAAVRHDPTLIEYGVDRYVIPASPTTLIALLRAVHYGWQQDRVAAGAAQVRDLGRELYERLRKMAVHFDKLRKGLETAVTAYNQSVGTLERRVLVSARRFRDLGAGTTDDLPEVPAIDAAPRELQPAAEDTEASD